MKMMHESVSASVQQALEDIRGGKAILIHDSAGRENEVDIVFSAALCSPENIAYMRRHAGGLICAAIGNDVAQKIGLPFMHELLENASNRYPSLLSLVEKNTPYGGMPAFSIAVNHRKSYTGVTDSDRSDTVTAIARVAELAATEGDGAAREFGSSLKAPGHVPLLIEAKGSLNERRGHTELSIRLMRLAGLPPAAVVCEMLDAHTFRALDVRKAESFARDNGLVLLRGEQIA